METGTAKIFTNYINENKEEVRQIEDEKSKQ